MAGLLDKIARQVINGIEPKKTSKPRPKTMSQTAYQKPVMVIPVTPVAKANEPETKPETPVVKPVAPIVGPEEQTVMIEAQISSENTKKIDVPVIITLEKEMTTENKKIEKEDYLLNQIDEFRAKAQQLQNLMLTKESKVQELQEIVDEKEVKAKELEHILNERQRKADGITEEVTKQIDNLIDKVTEKMEAIGASLGKELQDGQQINERQLEELKKTLGDLNGQQIEEFKSMLGSLNAQQAEELKNSLSELNTQLEVVKSDLSDKVHSENVQCYRNLADLLKSVEEKLDRANEIEKRVISVHKCTVAVIVLSVINMLGIVGLAAMIVFQGLF